MNWLLYLGGWWFVALILEELSGRLFVSMARKQDNPKSFLLGRVIGMGLSWTMVWIWLMWRFVA